MLIPYLFQTLTRAYWKNTAVTTRVTTLLEAASVMRRRVSTVF